MSSRPVTITNLVPDRPVERTRRAVDVIREHLTVASASDRPPVGRVVRSVAFWVAIVLPVVLLGFLFQGLSSASQTLLFVGLLATDVVALIVGHTYRRE